MNKNWNIYRVNKFVNLLGVFLLASISCNEHSYASGSFNSNEGITEQDRLRGSITPERLWWDLLHYDLFVRIDVSKKTFSGKNIIRFKALDNNLPLQIELQSPMKLDEVKFNGITLPFTRKGYSHFIDFPEMLTVGKEYSVALSFSGVPHEAKNAPWDGGVTWSKDNKGKPFIATANQGIGASIWWPNKDHAYDEPDHGIDIHIEVPKSLTAVANGRLVKVEKGEKTDIFNWKVTSPINNYGVNINVGDYVNWSELYLGEKGKLDMSYWVLRDNLSKAKQQFKDAEKTLEAFEYWFGPYPFYDDGYKLVEVPYLGMEHQSSVTYGNGFKNGYKGSDFSKTGHGMLFDFIIIHESGHEWFANNVTAKDVADLWVHESFTNYSESLFLEYHFGKKEGWEYVRGSRNKIKNDKPIVGQYNVNKEGSSDMYWKGGNMLHTLRQIIDDDKKWRSILRGINQRFYHQTVSGKTIENYISEQSGRDFSKVFDQYLRDTRIPVLEILHHKEEVRIRWAQVVEGFDMPIRLYLENKTIWVKPTQEWQKILEEKTEVLATTTIEVDPNFYVAVHRLLK